MSKQQGIKVLGYLKKGHTITHLEAIKLFGCSRLAAVILRLRDAGHDIHTELIPTADCPTGYGRYSLIKEAGKVLRLKESMRVQKGFDL